MSSGELTTTATKQAAPALPVHRTIKDLAALIVKHKERILEALPRGIDGDAVLKKAVMAVRKSPALLKANPASLFYAISEAVANGLEIGGHRQQCYLVPYGEEVQLILGYRGMIELVRRTGQMESATLQLVHDGDLFEYEEGDTPRLRHVPSADAESQSRPVTHVYVVFRLRGGVVVRNVWTAPRVNAHRDQYSEAYRRAELYIERQTKAKQPIDQRKLSPWHTSWHNMAYKTLIRDLFSRGLLPISEDVQVQIAREAYVENAAAPAIGRDTSLDDILGNILADDRQDVPAIAQQADDGPHEDMNLDGTAITPQDAQPMTQEEQEVLLELHLEQATSLGAVTGLRCQAEELFAGNDEFLAWFNTKCDAKEESIRHARSSGAT